MANLPEEANWEVGIYQWETSTPALGGAGGIMNRPLLELANRTLYLKNLVEPATDRVEPGTYTKLTVDRNGFVVDADDLAASDIPTIPWSKVNARPTSLSGYGILDAVPKAGGSMTGPLELVDGSTAPTPSASDSSTKLATTAFVQNVIGGANFPQNTRLMFAQATAPVGWTQVVSDEADNRMLRVVKTAGSGVGGTHSPILCDVVPVHTHSLSIANTDLNHAHSGATSGQSHNHYHNTTVLRDKAQPISTAGNAVFGDENFHGTNTLQSSTETGDAVHNYGSHYHSFTTNLANPYGQWSHSHTGVTTGNSSGANWQPRYINLILCKKD